MRLLGRERLNRLRGGNGKVEKWVCNWAAEILGAIWKQPSDVQDQFPNARQHTDDVFIFPVGDCNWVICLLIAFPQGVALITDLKVEDESN